MNIVCDKSLLCAALDGVSMAVYNRLIRAAAFKVVEL